MARLSPFFVVVLFCSCGGPDLLEWPSDESPDSAPDPDSPDPSTTSQVPSLQILRAVFEQEGPVVMVSGDSFKLSVRLVLSNGTSLSGIDSEADLPGSNLDDAVIWFSNNEGIAEVTDDGLVIGRNAGSTTVKASYLYQAAVIDVIVTNPPVAGAGSSPAVSGPSQSGGSSPSGNSTGNSSSSSDSSSGNTTEGTEDSSDSIPLVATEAPEATRDYFLSANDTLTIDFGTNSGFGAHLYPGIIYGPPRTGGTHVVTFGGGGSLVIELNGFIVVNGAGPDFTIFENAVVSNLWGNFFERAEVSASDDGVNFIPFPCDAFDPEEINEGCAGVTPVNATNNPLDPAVSGGDSYDLADVGLTEAKFIRIEDLDTCRPGDPTWLDAEGSFLCSIAGQQGFDLDAISIVNGVNE